MSDADRHCGQHRSRILTIQSAAEQKHLEEFLFKEKQIDQNIWLGGNRQNLKFAWRNDGVLISGQVYQNWASEKPSHNFPRACLQMNSAQNSEPGKWSDNYCFAMNAIVCERVHVPGELIPDSDDDDDNNDDRDCCRNVQNLLNKLEERFNSRMKNVEKLLEKRDNLIDKLRDEVNEAKQLASGYRNRIEELKEKLEQFERFRFEEAREISNNFTSIVSVFEHYNRLFSELNEAMEQNSGSSGTVDLGDLKSELRDYVDKQIERFGGGGSSSSRDVLTDAKLDYVHYRRALMVKKNGNWIQVGYV